MVGQPWRHETAAAKETSDDSDEIDSEVESDYEEKLFGLLQSGKHRVRNPDGTFRCPFCPGKKKQNYQFKDLLQHADGIGARHRAFARFVRTDPSFAHDHAIINDKSEHGNYKNLLQQLLQQRHKPLPSYYTLREGQPHRPKFTAFVVVDGQHFPSYYHYHARVKDAEQDAARVAYSILVGRQESDHVNVTDELELTDQDVKFSKSILHDFAAKTAANQPCYTVFNPEVSSHRHLFVASVRFAGHTYTGEYATKKKDAEQKAARVAVKSILATKNTCMVQIIRSKRDRDDGEVSQEEDGAPPLKRRRVVAVVAGDECPICLDELETDDLVAWSGCSMPHVFHGECLQTNLKQSVTCPICRLDMWN